MKILITGISGFVARHFVELLSTINEPVQITGVYNRRTPEFPEKPFKNITCRFYRIDLLESNELRELIASVKPDYVLHLASKSSVASSWLHPGETIRHNTGAFISLIEQIRLLGMKCRILSVGSAEEYGNIQPQDLPLTETLCPNPVSPYGTSRVMQQKLVEIYSKNYGLDIMHTRSFNHIGPHQRDEFVVSSFAKQITDQKLKGNQVIKIKVGNLEITRDFTDVRDVVRAYYLLLLNGKNGSTYNVCSGKGILLKDLIGMFAKLTETDIDYISDPKVLRPSENLKLVGSFKKINSETGWAPEITPEQSLNDLLNYWETKLSFA